MAIFSLAGSQFSIGGVRTEWRAATIDAAVFAGETWISVGGATSLGSMSGDWSTQDVTTPNPMDPDAPLIPQHAKAMQPARSMQIAVDLDPSDAGQIRMLAAEQAVDPYAFRIVFPNATQRLFVALVIGANDRMDEANNVVGLVFSLILQSNVVR